MKRNLMIVLLVIFFPVVVICAFFGIIWMAADDLLDALGWKESKEQS